MLKRILTFLAISTLFLSVSSSHSDVITVHIPIVDDSPQLHIFYHTLLETALKEDGHTPELITPRLPQTRIKHYLDYGEITIFWLVKSEERNKKYILVKEPLTNGLIGKRILFIKKGDQHLYDGVKTLDDFRNLNAVGYMGKEWFDVKVWKANSLRYQEHSGSWKNIFALISRGREYNYFSRGLNEIVEEVKQYKGLAIEKRLVFIYDRDFHFYLSKTGENAGAKYKDVIEHALKKAGESRLIERLVNKYWAKDLKVLNYDKRIKIDLKTPK